MANLFVVGEQILSPLKPKENGKNKGKGKKSEKNVKSNPENVFVNTISQN